MFGRQLPGLLTGFVLILMTSLLPVAKLRAAEGERPAELKPLERWIGEWEMESSIKPNEFNPHEIKATYSTSIKWSVNGRFLHCEAKGSGVSGEQKFKAEFAWIATYDRQMMAFSSIVLWSNIGADGDFWGLNDRATGQWDEKTRTLTLKGVDKDRGTTTTSVTTWADNDNHSFVTKTTDANGKVVMEMLGKAKRKK